MSLIYPPGWDYEQIRNLCQEVMQTEMQGELFEGLVAREELRQLQQGHTIVMPCDVEHARAMFKMACFYLSQYDPEFKLTLE